MFGREARDRHATFCDDESGLHLGFTLMATLPRQRLTSGRDALFSRRGSFANDHHDHQRVNMSAADARDASNPKPIRRLEESLVNKIAAGEVDEIIEGFGDAR